MTDKEYDKLTDEEQWVKVAECAGWKSPSLCIENNADGNSGEWIDGYYGTPPDYLNDLNACYEFEEDLPMISEDGKSLFDYTRTLSRLVRKPRTIPMVIHDWELLHATARQRCKAFVLTSTE